MQEPIPLSGRRYITKVSLIIRTAGPDDLPQLREVYRRSSLSNEGDREALLQHPDYLVLPDAAVLEGRTRVAERPQEGIVGFATIERQSSGAELVDLFVDPDSMRQGVARALITDAVGTLADDGVGVLEVTANRHALEFYTAMAFEVVGEATTDLGSGLRMRLSVGAKGQDS
jgi:ribosomal protein S18 acetylase RimI-like enzyme